MPVDDLEVATGESSHGARRAAAVVAATVGAAAAVTTAAAPAADAAGKYRVWDRVAHCESSNKWNINTGNGFYGGLQFTKSTWRGYGGHKYAGRADRATRLEQIEVARRVLKRQGPGAWPVCSGHAGLTKKSGQATSARLPDTAGASAGGSAKEHHKAKHRHKSHHHAKKSHHKAKHGKGSSYTVRSGDTLAKIAKKKHVHGGWHALYKANKHKLHNPNRIHVGQVLHLPH